MTFTDYLLYTEAILADPEKYPLYTDQEYYNFTKLNYARMNRWLKKFSPSDSAQDFFDKIDQKQTWILITEPWCGDAAHSLAQIHILVKNNPYISLDIQLRDAEGSLIDNYLTNGGKSIPKLIIRDNEGNDLAVWGPRPNALQEVFADLKQKDVPFVEIKEVLQKWYNDDQGKELQKELIELLK